MYGRESIAVCADGCALLYGAGVQVSRLFCYDQRVNDLVVLREAAFLLFRKDQLAVGDDVELTLPARYCVGVMSRALVQLGRETRSPAVIAVSDGAVEDLDLHLTEPTEAHGRSRALQTNSRVL